MSKNTDYMAENTTSINIQVYNNTKTFCFCINTRYPPPQIMLVLSKRQYSLMS